MSLPQVARVFYAALAAMSERARADARALWWTLEPTALVASWAATGVGEALFAQLSTWQLTAASAGGRYVAASLHEQSAPARFADKDGGGLDPRALAGVASDGRDLDGLLFQPVVATVTALDRGAISDRAMTMGAAALETIVGTQVSDAGRAAVDVAMTAEPAVTGWARMLTPPSCGRCAVLAGRRYRWSDGFPRHPLCDCVHVPAVDDGADDLRTDPRAYFDSLTAEEQARYFTVAGAQSIRDGADVAQVVNARRAAAGLSQPGRLTATEQRLLREGRARGRLARTDVYGRQVFTTAEGTTRRGVAGRRLIEVGGATELRTREQRRADRARGDVARRPTRARTPRLMPEAIQELAGGDRDQAVRLLRRFGYIT